MKKNILMAIAMLFTITCLNAQEITDFGRAALKVRTATEDPSGWIPSHPVFLYHSTGDEVVPFDNYLAASKQFGEQVKFYPSMINGGHVNTGMEYFLSNQRIECLRLLASMDSNGMTSITMPNATTPQWYDLFGRHIEGEPVSKGIFITRGKKILIK